MEICKVYVNVENEPKDISKNMLAKSLFHADEIDGTASYL